MNSEQKLKYDGLVLKTVPHKEAGVLATILTSDHIESFIIRGAKKLTSGTRIISNPLTLITFDSTNVEYKTITKSKILNNYTSIKDDLYLYNSCLIIIEKLLYFSKYVNNYHKLYEFVLFILDNINKNNSLLLIDSFEIKLLYLLGVNPILNNCSICNKEITEGFLSITNGGIVCDDCIVADEILLDKDLTNKYKLLYFTKKDELLKLNISNDSLNKLSKFIDEYYLYHLEFDSKAKSIIRSIKYE